MIDTVFKFDPHGPIAWPMIVDTVFEFTGLDVAIETLGLAPMISIMILLGGVVGAYFLGGRAMVKDLLKNPTDSVTGDLKSELGSTEDSDKIIQTVNEKDDQILSEATQRLQQEGKEINGENLTGVLDEIEKQQSGEGEITGVITNEDTRKPVVQATVSPDDIENEKKHLEVVTKNGERKFIRTAALTEFPSEAQYGWVTSLFSDGLQTKGADLRTAIYADPIDTNLMLNKLNRKKADLLTTKRRKEEKGQINTTQEEQDYSRVTDLHERLSAGQTTVFDVGIYMQIVADDEETLQKAFEELRQKFPQSGAKMTPLPDQQLNAFRTVAPLGKDYIRKRTYMDLRSLATIFPFVETPDTDPTGVLFGIDSSSNTPLIVDRFKMSGHNVVVSGKIGSGKSYLVKLLHFRRYMMDDEVEMLIIDPVGGFTELVDTLGGDTITVDRSTKINPMEIRAGAAGSSSPEDDPYKTKVRSLIQMFEVHFGDEKSLNKIEQGVLNSAIRLAYLEKGITQNPKTHDNPNPKIQNVLDILERISEGEQPEEFLDIPEELEHKASLVGTVDIDDGAGRQGRREIQAAARDLRFGLEEFAPNGIYSFMNGESTVDLSNDIIQFDLESAIGAGDEELILHVMIDFVFQRAKSTTTRSLITVDEAHRILDNETVLSNVDKLVRHSRHYNSGITLISQTAAEFVKNDTAKNIYDQADIKLLMKHKDLGQEEMDALDLTENDRQYVIGAQAGNSGDYSQSLAIVGDKKHKLNVRSFPQEHPIADDDAEHPWTFLVRNDIVSMDIVPTRHRRQVQAELDAQAAAASEEAEAGD